MLPKFFASWLVVLVIAPFTAPFSTCDLPGLFGDSTEQHSPVAPQASVSLNTDAAVPVALAVSTAGRTRLVPLSWVPLPASAAASSLAPVMWSVATADGLREHIALTTILRL